jgi:hypothetical protein
MPRLGLTENTEKLREKVMPYFTTNELTYQKMAEILVKLDGSRVNEKKAYEQAFKKGYFSGLVSETIASDNVITNEVAWKIICDYLKK